MSKSKKSASLPSSIFLDAQQLKEVLANKSAADSWHDFHTPISGIRKIIEENEAKYIAGLPPGVTHLGDFADEGAALSSVVKCPDPKCEYSDYLVGKCRGQKEIPGLTRAYQIETINGTQYSVKSMVVAKGSSGDGTKVYIGARTFIDGLDIKNHSAIVIDAAAVSVLDILKSGDADRDPHTIYYVYVPEVVNDPAGKTPIDSAVFRATGGVKLIPCISNEPPSFNYNYSFDSKSTGATLKDKFSDNYKKFFTKYNFQLSELQVNQKGKKLDYTTNLVISSTDPGNKNSETITDSKKKNNITFLKAILVNTIKLLGITKASDVNVNVIKNTFLFNTKFQQKRSGDWLQVIACLLLKSRKLKYIPQKGPAIANIEQKISDIYFVTHDRIALAFALLCGVQCIYTHAQTKSVYVFKEASPEALAEREAEILALKQKRFDDIYESIGISGDDVASSKGEYDFKYKRYAGRMTEYTTFRNNIVTTYAGQIKGLKDDPKYSTLFAREAEFNVDIFDEFTANLFSLCFLQKNLLLAYPDIQKKYDEISPLAQKIRDIRRQRNYDETFNLYENLMMYINSFVETINKYVIVTDAKNREPVVINFAATIAALKKTANYKLANGWSWSNTLGNSRTWEAFKSIIGTSSYTSDKNAFLYDMDILPNDIKIYITQTYGAICDRLSNVSIPSLQINVRNNPVPINPDRGEKFLVIAKGFCAEVFLNFGYPLPEPEPALVQELPAVPDQSTMPPAPPVEESSRPMPREIQPIPDIDAKITEIMSIRSTDNLLRDEVITIENSAYTIGLNILTRAGAKYLSEIVSAAYVEDARELNAEATTINSEGEEGFAEGTDIISGGFVQTRAQKAVSMVGFENNDTGYVMTNNIENNIKDTTYVLLNALIDYKENIYILDRDLLQGIVAEMDEEPPIEESPDEESAVKESAVKDSGARGGAPIFNDRAEKIAALNELAEQLNIQPSTKPFDKDMNLLKDGVQFFHPMIPIYMIAEALNEIAADDNINESLDYKLYINFLNYLTKLRDTLSESYNSKQNIDVAVAYIVGEGLKELLISGSVYDMDYEIDDEMGGGDSTLQSLPSAINPSVLKLETPELKDLGNGIKDLSGDLASGPGEKSYCKNVIGMSKSEFLPVAILNDSLSSYISGFKNKTQREVETSKKILNSKIFTNYIKRVDVPGAFNSDADINEPITSFQARCFEFLIETGNIIITDRGGNALTIPPENIDVAEGVVGSEPVEETTLIDEKPEEKLDLGFGLPEPNKNSSDPAGAGGSRKRKVKKNKRTIKQNRKTKRKVTRFYRDKIKRFTRKHKKSDLYTF
jgi:hypothetical protein